MQKSKNSSAVKNVCGEKSVMLANSGMECAITLRGGHLAPVTFFRDTKSPVSPYFISPWQGEAGDTGEPVLDMLRGDFFCLPFGANPTWRGENHRVHGETAYAKWKPGVIKVDGDTTSLKLTLNTKVRPGRVEKRIYIREGESVVYLQHELSGFRGRMPLGHHAILTPPPVGKLYISKSPLLFGETSPRPTLGTANREYYALAPQKRFRSLNRVPTIWKDQPWADAAVFPEREGFVDILSLYDKPGPHPAWTCAVAPEAGYLWFSLKDAAVLPATTLWMENRGRHAAPWSGRTCCIGIEDTCAYHAEGLKASVQQNPIRQEGIPTSIQLSRRNPTLINYIQGVARIPKGFDRVRRITFSRETIVFTSYSNQKSTAAVCADFLHQGAGAWEKA